MRGTRPGRAGQVGLPLGSLGLCQDLDSRSLELDSEARGDI